MLKDIRDAVGDNATPTVLLVLFILSICVDVSKLPLNPWKALAKLGTSALNALGKALTSDIKSDIQSLHDRLTDLESAQKVELKQMRRRAILRFADECRIGTRHSKEMFDNVLKDISDYERMCSDTHDPNHVLQEGVRIIEECYRKCMADNDFL